MKGIEGQVVLRAPFRAQRCGRPGVQWLDLNQNGQQDELTNHSGSRIQGPWYEPQVEEYFVTAFGGEPGEILTRQDIGNQEVDIPWISSDTDGYGGDVDSWSLDRLTEVMAPGAEWALQTDANGDLWYLAVKR